jgi:uncharacterized membrane protein
MSKKIILAALSAVVVMGISSEAIAAGESNMAPGANMEMVKMHKPVKGLEKCYGIAKSGKNDCASATEACAGQAKADGAKDAWLGVPTGTCDKIVGGSTSVGSAA